MEKYTSFAEAVKANDMYAVKEMLDENPTLIHSVTAEGLSMIMLAAYNHHFKMMEILTLRKRHLDIFEAAASGASLELERILSKDKTQLVAYSNDGYTALDYACWFGRIEVARHLISKGAQINSPSNNASKVTPLHAAVAGKHLEIAEMLIKHGANVNAKQQNDVTPMHSAAQNGQAAMIKLLIDNKADVHAKTSDGKTPSDLAKEKGLQEVVTYLAKY